MSREYDLDAARSALMMLGVVLHAANVYAEPATWLVSDPVRSEGLRAESSWNAGRAPAVAGEGGRVLGRRILEGVTRAAESVARHAR